MTTYDEIGQLTLGACVPTAVALEGSLSANIALQLPSLNAQLAGLIDLKASIGLTPPTLAVQLDAAIALVAKLRAAIALGLPGIAVDVTAIAAIIAELEASIGKLNADLTLAAGIGVLLGTPGVWLYHVEGDAHDIIPGGIPGVSTPVEGVILLGADAGAITALKAMFRTS